MAYAQPSYASGMVEPSHYQQDRRNTRASPTQVEHNGQIVVLSSDNVQPDSPISYRSATGTEVSDPSLGAVVPYQDRQMVQQREGVHNPSTLPKEILKMKKNRRRATVGAGVVGGVAGLLVLGPVGAVLGGAGGAVAAKQLGKRRERKRLEKVSQQEIARQMENSPELPVHATDSAEIM
mmetsp:Transcript_20652/g.26646  ORF Transcript_20652/g.26646 Transcript_20652/m.26646 type:complete len:179 (+) Transcript_20652:137-673(+)|eukprot:CAMPEP_0198153200 /NCGR_PEP_ID=MMETSP1443-20131203/63162_1 /TAXON_ID=186043 /ORGANISM="Entomoneis sp., Strain CCMP2396" /LENGTH=178 /DNA_ID=CAMNT_0043819451 /DNA_START=120 /DNA_END=656 /DNA_ORIENTATION=+